MRAGRLRRFTEPWMRSAASGHVDGLNSTAQRIAAEVGSSLHGNDHTLVMRRWLPSRGIQYRIPGGKPPWTLAGEGTHFEPWSPSRRGACAE